MKVKATARKSASKAKRLYGKNLSILLQKTVWDISDSDTDSESIETDFAPLIQTKLEKIESESECDRDADTVCDDNAASTSGYVSAESQHSSVGWSSEPTDNPMSTEGSDSEISDTISTSDDSDNDETDSENDSIGNEDPLLSTLAATQQSFNRSTARIYSLSLLSKVIRAHSHGSPDLRIIRAWKKSEKVLLKVISHGKRVRQMV